MNLRCQVNLHAAPPPHLAIKNGGVWFGQCPLCLTTIIKRGGERWREVPRGYRIVYRHKEEYGSEVVGSSRPRSPDGGLAPGAFRSPHSPTIPEGRRVYAVGDVHGRYDLLNAMFQKIQVDNQDRQPAEVSVILLGDLIDRGPESARVVELARKPLEWSELRVLLGNHEAAMIDGLDGNLPMLGLWMRNGGLSTLASWGLDPAGMLQHPLEEAVHAIRSIIPQDQVHWLRQLPLSITIGDYLFVHAGVRPGVPIDHQSAQDMLWIRAEFLESELDHGAMIVHGHTITETVNERPNRIGLDTGAYLTGRLTAMGFEGTERWTIVA